MKSHVPSLLHPEYSRSCELYILLKPLKFKKNTFFEFPNLSFFVKDLLFPPE